MTASLLLRASLLLFLSVVAACEAKGAVQPPPTNCTTAANCMLGTDASGKWLKQPLPSGTQGPPGPAGAAGATGPAGPQGIAGAAGVNGGPLTSKTYVGGNAIVPNLWYAIDKSISSNVAVVLPPAGVAPWTNPALSCWTNYGTGQTTFTSTSPLYGAPVFLGQNQTVCFGVDDLSPAGWRGDGGN